MAATRLLHWRDLGLRFLSVFGWLPGLLSRLTIGAVFIPSGWGKLHNLPTFVDRFRGWGIPAPEIQAPFVACVELVCGSLVLVGLATRLVSIPLIATMVVAIVSVVWQPDSTWSDLSSVREFLYIVILVWLVFAGAGTLSLDRLLVKSDRR
jgi:putative oxidoreductase